jgi:hypothetical protein
MRFRRFTKNSAIPYADPHVPFIRGRRYATTVAEKKRMLRLRGPVVAAWPGRGSTGVFQVIKRRARAALIGGRA